MDSSPYFPFLKRWWWSLVLATWVAGLVGLVVASGVPPTYETEVRLLVGPLSTDFNTQRAAGQTAQTYAELATSEPLLEEVATVVGSPVTAAQVREAVRVRADGTTRLVSLTVQAQDPALSVEIANALASGIQALSETLTAGGAVQPEGRITIIDPPALPDEPVAPQVALIVVMAAAAGLIAAAGVALLVEYMTDTIRDRHDLPRVAPLLATVRSFRSSSPEDLTARMAHTGERATGSGELRPLIAKLGVTEDGTVPRKILVLGTRAGDGAGAFAATLASSLAEGARTVALVDANGIDREASELLETDARFGMVDMLLTGRSRMVKRAPGIRLLPYGTSEPLVELNSEDGPRKLLDQLVSENDIVVVNGPTVDRSPSGFVWARLTEATIVVVHAQYITRRHLIGTISDLDRVGARMGGIVLCEGRTPRAPRASRRSLRQARRTARPPGRLATALSRLNPFGTRRAGGRGGGENAG